MLIMWFNAALVIDSALLTAGTIRAQNYPNKPIRLLTRPPAAAAISRHA
jgi:hypothetical protein